MNVCTTYIDIPDGNYENRVEQKMQLYIQSREEEFTARIKHTSIHKYKGDSKCKAKNKNK